MSLDVEVTVPTEQEPTNERTTMQIPLGKLWSVDLETYAATKLRNTGWDFDKELPLTDFPPIELPLNGQHTQVPPGVCAVLGQAATGKTQLSLYLQERGFTRIAFREPSENAIVSEAHLASAIARFLHTANPGEALVIDSLRTLLYTGEVGGGTAKGGVSMGIYALLTVLDLLVREKGLLLVLLINPLSAGADEFEVQRLAAVGSAGSVIVTEQPGSAQLSTRLGRSRDFRPVTYSLGSIALAPQEALKVVSTGADRTADPVSDLIATVHRTYANS